jgi:hypothetical protein
MDLLFTSIPFPETTRADKREEILRPALRTHP